MALHRDHERKEEEVPLLQDIESGALAELAAVGGLVRQLSDSTDEPWSPRRGDRKDFSTTPCGTVQGSGPWKQYQFLRINQSGKIFEFDHASLLSWRSLVVISGTIFSHRKVWIVAPWVTMVALSIAALVFLVVPDARRFDTGRFNEAVLYIKYFIALMLGFFVTRCYTRWWESVSTFKNNLTAIKQLLYTLRAVQVREEVVDEIQRLCVASCYVLHAEVHVMQVKEIDEREARWKRSMTELVARKIINEAEQVELERDYRKHAEQIMGVHSTMVWTWIGEVMGKLRNEKNVAPPMFVRLLFLCHDCLAQVEHLKTHLMVQIPFQYAHMLAVLVHLANSLMAISVGLTLGSALDEIVSRDEALALHTHTHKPNMVREFYEALQVCMMQAVVLLLQPTLYQAFLVIAHGLSYPYGDELWHMPVETYIDHMVLDLRVMKESRDERRTEFLCGHMDREKKEKDESEEDDDDE